MIIQVNPLNKSIQAKTGATLLDNLLANDIPISYSCMSGRCGTCRCKVVQGEIIGPSAAEGRLAKNGQYVLACKSQVQGDCIIEVPEPDEVVTHPTKTLKGTVAAYEKLTDDIRRLIIKPNKPLAFSPGQYVNLTFWAEDGTRSYSMAGLPNDDALEFHIRLVPDGRVTAKLDEHIQVGGKLKLNGPLGASYLRTKHQEPMLCLATGTGLAPILSIVRGALEKGMTNPIHLLYGGRSDNDLYELDLLNSLAESYDNFQFKISLSLSSKTIKHDQGLITDLVENYYPDLNNWRIYLAGAPAMVEAATQTCLHRGAQIEHIYADAFYPSGM